MALLNLLFGLVVLAVVGYFSVKMVRTHFYYNQVDQRNQAKWAHIAALLKSDDPSKVSQGQREYLEHLSRGPYEKGSS